MKKTQKGFTLIELLIVIAIIGILAGVILVSTSSAQNKAKYAAGKSSMRSALTYMTLCVSGGSTINATASVAGGGAICLDPAVVDATATWPSLSGPGCTGVSSTVAGVYTATCGGTAITCTASTGTCS